MKVSGHGARWVSGLMVGEWPPHAVIDNGTFRVPLLFAGLRRFVYLVCRGAGRRAELTCVI